MFKFRSQVRKANIFKRFEYDEMIGGLSVVENMSQSLKTQDYLNLYRLENRIAILVCFAFHSISVIPPPPPSV